MQTVGFVGLGKLGLDCAEVFAQHYKVLGHDIYPRTSDQIEIVSFEQVIDETVALYEHTQFQ